MHNEVISWDALLVTNWTEDKQKRTVWERKKFKAPDSKDIAQAEAKKIFEQSSENEKSVVVKNVIRLGSYE